MLKVKALLTVGIANGVGPHLPQFQLAEGKEYTLNPNQFENGRVEGEEGTMPQWAGITAKELEFIEVIGEVEEEPEIETGEDQSDFENKVQGEVETKPEPAKKKSKKSKKNKG